MLSQNIQQARINLDNKTSLSDIHKQIHAKKRENLINQNKQATRLKWRELWVMGSIETLSV